MQNVALVDAQEVYKEHTMADDKVVLKMVQKGRKLRKRKR